MPVCIQPFAVGQAATDNFFQLLVPDHAVLLEIGYQNAPRLQTTLLNHLALIHLERAGFGSHDQGIVVEQTVTAGSQSVAVQGCTYQDAVGEADAGRAVPGFHQRLTVLVEGTFVIWHGLVVLPGFRDHHHQRLGDANAIHGQKLEHVIEIRAVGEHAAANRKDHIQLLLGEVTGLANQAFLALPPVDVTLHGIDLAVVGDHPEGLG